MHTQHIIIAAVILSICFFLNRFFGFSLKLIFLTILHSDNFFTNIFPHKLIKSYFLLNIKSTLLRVGLFELNLNVESIVKVVVKNIKSNFLNGDLLQIGRLIHK